MSQKILSAMAKGMPLVLEETTVVLTPAQILALNATPVTVIRVRDEYEMILPFAMAMYKPAGTAYAGIAGGEDFALETSAGTDLLTMETTGFLDQTTEQYRVSTVGAVTAVAANMGKDLQISIASGEITTGDSPVTVTIAFYRLGINKPASIY